MSLFLTLLSTYVTLMSLLLQERDEELAREQQRQEENDVMRKQFAQAANAFHGWLTETRYTALPVN